VSWSGRTQGPSAHCTIACMLMALEFHIAYVPGDGPEQVEKEVVVVMIDDGERRTKNQTHVGV